MILGEASKLTKEQREQGLSADDIKTAKERIRAELEPLQRTVVWQQGGAATISNYSNSAEQIALMMMKKGASPQEAAVKAVESIAGFKYEFEDRWRVPKTQLGGSTTMTALRDGAAASLFDIAGPPRERAPGSPSAALSPLTLMGQPGSAVIAAVGSVVRQKIAQAMYEQRVKGWQDAEQSADGREELLVPGYPKGVRPEAAEEQWRDTVRANGFWVTSPGDGGLTLYVRSGLGAQPVLNAKGMPVRRTWSELSAVGNAVPAAYMRDVYKSGVRMP